MDDLKENNIGTEDTKITRLPLTSDYVFKRIFAREENNSMLKDFLEAILNIHIDKVEVKNPELTPNMADEKLGILDLKLDIDNERVVDVEMQVSNEHNIKERSSTYLSKLAAEQLKAKQNYKELKKIITINILKYNYLERNSYHSIARMKYEDTNPTEFVDMGYEQEEKEAMRAAREEEREQAKLQKEIEEARKSINKEKKHYENAKEKLILQLEKCSTDEEKSDIQSKINEIDEKLAEINKNLEDIDYREANKRAGYVYVISNIGSFGEGIYKIGMTRRLEPMDRVDELGDASVPFKFDVHAMIFSDDAPALENALHKAFDDRKVNMINGRKEFFRVSLEEIEKVVKENHEKLIEFNEVPDAEQYRETLKIKESLIKGKNIDE